MRRERSKGHRHMLHTFHTQMIMESHTTTATDPPSVESSQVHVLLHALYGAPAAQVLIIAFATIALPTAGCTHDIVSRR